MYKKIILFGLVFIITISGCIREYEQLEGLDKGALPSYSPNLKLVIRDPPPQNQIGELEFIISTYGSNSSVNVEIELPEGLLLVDGNLSWHGDVIIPQEELEKHKPPYGPNNPLPVGEVIRKIRFRPTSTGNWTIVGKINRLKPNSTEILKTIGTIKLYLSILENKSVVSETPFTKPVEPCEPFYLDGELVQCTTTESPKNFIETEID